MASSIRAFSQSLRTVLSVTESASAISVSVIPPKYRISTTFTSRSLTAAQFLEGLIDADYLAFPRRKRRWIGQRARIAVIPSSRAPLSHEVNDNRTHRACRIGHEMGAIGDANITSAGGTADTLREPEPSSPAECTASSASIGCARAAAGRCTDAKSVAPPRQHHRVSPPRATVWYPSFRTIPNQADRLRAGIPLYTVVPAQTIDSCGRYRHGDSVDWGRRPDDRPVLHGQLVRKPTLPLITDNNGRR